MFYRQMKLTSRALKAKAVPILLGVTAAISYSCVPVSSIAEAPFQAAWIATGVALCSCFLQSILEEEEDVGLYLVFLLTGEG